MTNQKQNQRTQVQARQQHRKEKCFVKPCYKLAAVLYALSFLFIFAKWHTASIVCAGVGGIFLFIAYINTENPII